jgi:hypothetical protein
MRIIILVILLFFVFPIQAVAGDCEEEQDIRINIDQGVGFLDETSENEDDDRAHNLRTIADSLVGLGAECSKYPEAYEYANKVYQEVYSMGIEPYKSEAVEGRKKVRSKLGKVTLALKGSSKGVLFEIKPDNKRKTLPIPNEFTLVAPIRASGKTTNVYLAPGTYEIVARSGYKLIEATTVKVRAGSHETIELGKKRSVSSSKSKVKVGAFSGGMTYTLSYQGGNKVSLSPNSEVTVATGAAVLTAHLSNGLSKEFNISIPKGNYTISLPSSYTLYLDGALVAQKIFQGMYDEVISVPMVGMDVHQAVGISIPNSSGYLHQCRMRTELLPAWGYAGKLTKSSNVSTLNWKAMWMSSGGLLVGGVGLQYSAQKNATIARTVVSEEEKDDYYEASEKALNRQKYALLTGSLGVGAFVTGAVIKQRMGKSKQDHTAGQQDFLDALDIPVICNCPQSGMCSVVYEN